MIDINAEAQKSLLKSGLDIVFQYPQSKETMPVVSFFTISEKGSFGADDEAWFQDGTIAVDIFAHSPAQCGELALRVNGCMENDGWRRDFSMDVADDADGVFHKTMRFTKSFYIK